MSLNRTVRLSVLYGGTTFGATSATDTGDTEVQVNEQIPAGQSKTFPFAVTAANLQTLMAWCDQLNVVIDVNTTDVILAANTGASLWSTTLGGTSPLVSGDTTTVTCDNTGGSDAANVFIAALSETP